MLVGYMRVSSESDRQITDLQRDALLAAVALHVLAIALYAAAKGHNLLRPMITGRKLLPARICAPRLAPAMLALLLLVVSATAATLLATYL